MECALAFDLNWIFEYFELISMNWILDFLQIIRKRKDVVNGIHINTSNFRIL